MQFIQNEEKFDGQVTCIKLNTPPANILTAAMMKELAFQLDQEISHPHKKLIVLSGAGKHFSFGASVEEHTKDKVAHMLPVFHSLIGKIIHSNVPTLAQVSGQCLGGGFELALSCSFIFADGTAKMGVPEIQLGVFPPVAAALLPILSNFSLTSQMILTGEKRNAEELYQTGVVTHHVKEDLEGAVMRFVEEQILPKSASSLRMAHRAARMILAKQYQDSIQELETLYLKDLMATHDAKEGIESFLEKRKPKWKDN